MVVSKGYYGPYVSTFGYLEGDTEWVDMTTPQHIDIKDMLGGKYYPRNEYLNLLSNGSEESGLGGLGVFMLQYSPLVSICKSKKHNRGSKQVMIHPLAIIPTTALQALVSIIA